MGVMRKFLLSMAVLTLFMPVGAARARGPELPPFVPKLPQGWRDLRFGMSEEAARKAIQSLKGPQAKEWEKTPLTFFVLPEPAVGRLAKFDVDAGRVHHWMINDLNEGAATVRAWFDHGKLFAVHVLGTLDQEAFIRKAAEAYGAEPKRLKVRFYEGTQDPPRELDAAVWRGNGTTAIIYQPSGFGPELLIVSDAGIEAMRKLHGQDPNGVGAGSDPASKAREEGTRF